MNNTNTSPISAVLLRLFIAFSFIFLGTFNIIAQSIEGYILSEDKEGIPFANIWINQLSTGTTADANGKYYYQFEIPGEYEILVSAIGYETQAVTVFITDTKRIKDVVLPTNDVELNEIVVKVRKRDPAYEIIQKAIENKKKNRSSLPSFRAQMYVKAIEEVEKKKQDKTNDDRVSTDGFDAEAEFDAADAKKQKEKELMEKLSKVNMVEMRTRLNYQYPNDIKEEKLGHKKYGSDRGLFIPRYSELDFDFYDNMVNLGRVGQMPLISPIARTAILSYKFKLLETLVEDGGIVYKIKFWPRKTGNATANGIIYINEENHSINRIALDLPKSNLRFSDKFKIDVTYQLIEDSIWVLERTRFDYETKDKKSAFKGSTTLNFSEYEPNYNFPEKFFGNELSVATKETYKRDSTFWNQERPEQLSESEQEIVSLHDSIDVVKNSPAYKDSVQRAYNKVTLAELLYDGPAFRDYKTKQQLYTLPIPGLLNARVAGGFRMGPYGAYFKRWENGTMIRTSAQLTYGFLNKDPMGFLNFTYRYNPYRHSSIRLYTGRFLSALNPRGNVRDMLQSTGYYIRDRVKLGHRFEIVNGLFFESYAELNMRRSLENYQHESVISDVFDSVLNWVTKRESSSEDGGNPDEDNIKKEPLSFDDYNVVFTDFKLSYTPKQRYMTEPNRKVILGSKYPTFSLFYQKGWYGGPFNSKINFDFLEGAIEQDVVMGTFGNSKYKFKIGQYFNTHKMDSTETYLFENIDLRRFNKSDVYFYNDPVNSFQALGTAIGTTDLFVELHYVHHFNGALINNIPLLKKSRISVFGGAGFMWANEDNFNHTEFFVGLERVFKLSARRRMRLGISSVFAKSNNIERRVSPIKISLEFIDTWKEDWSL